MNLTQIRLELSIRTAYEETILGQRSDALQHVLEVFEPLALDHALTLHEEILGRLVKVMNYSVKKENEQQVFANAVMLVSNMAILDEVTETMRPEYVTELLNTVIKVAGTPVPASTVTGAYFVDANGVQRDIRELDQVIDDIVFPETTPAQRKALEAFWDATSPKASTKSAPAAPDDGAMAKLMARGLPPTGSTLH